MSWFTWKRPRNVLAAVGTAAIAEAARAAASAATGAALAVGSALSVGGAAVAGAAAKKLVETLASRVSSIERKLDVLVGEPLISGIVLLRQALLILGTTEAEAETRNGLLDDAHVALVKASVLAESREDVVLILCLDCLALGLRHGKEAVARDQLSAVEAELVAIRRRVAALTAEATDRREGSEALDRFLSGRDVPTGYMEQRLLARWIRSRAAKVVAEADQAKRRLELLEDLTALSGQMTLLRQSPG